MSSKNFFWAKTSVALILSLKTVENITKEAIKARVIDVKITLVSNYRCPIWKKFKSDTCNRTPTWSHADYVTNKRAENQSRSRILL